MNEIYLKQKLHSLEHDLLELCVKLGSFGQAFIDNHQHYQCELNVDLGENRWGYHGEFLPSQQEDKIGTIILRTTEYSDEEIILFLVHEYIHAFQNYTTIAGLARDGRVPLSPYSALKMFFVEELDASAKTSVFDYFWQCLNNNGVMEEFSDPDYISKALRHYSTPHLYKNLDKNYAGEMRSVYINNCFIYYENGYDDIQKGMRDSYIGFLRLTEDDLWEVSNTLGFNSFGPNIADLDIKRRIVMPVESWKRLEMINEAYDIIDESKLTTLREFLQSQEISESEFLQQRYYFW